MEDTLVNQNLKSHMQCFELAKWIIKEHFNFVCPEASNLSTVLYKVLVKCAQKPSLCHWKEPFKRRR